MLHFGSKVKIRRVWGRATELRSESCRDRAVTTIYHSIPNSGAPTLFSPHAHVLKSTLRQQTQGRTLCAPPVFLPANKHSLWSWHTDTKPCVMLEMNVQDTGSLRMLGVPLSHAFVTARGLTRGLSNASRVPPFPFLIYVATATARATATAMVTASASRARAWVTARAAAAASSRARAVSLVLLSRVLRR